MKKLVKVKAIKTAVTTVRGDRIRQNIVTNEDKAAAEAAEKAGGGNAHTFLVTKDIADQLVAKEVVKIIEEDVDAPEDDVSIEGMAAQRLGENAKGDAKTNDTITGADTRDTTAFSRRPLERTGQGTAELLDGSTAGNGEGEGGDEGSDADAPPSDPADGAASTGNSAPAAAKPAAAAGGRRAPNKPAATT